MTKRPGSKIDPVPWAPLYRLRKMGNHVSKLANDHLFAAFVRFFPTLASDEKAAPQRSRGLGPRFLVDILYNMWISRYACSRGLKSGGIRHTDNMQIYRQDQPYKIIGSDRHDTDRQTFSRSAVAAEDVLCLRINGLCGRHAGGDRRLLPGQQEHRAQHRQ
ncbi:hypothetical protein DESC_700078 [Desulfosarcina cetonica]|nr:hypothetical protein DESC_700078 [Desulfosarcina cetonica]